jgi:putative membrane protein
MIFWNLWCKGAAFASTTIRSAERATGRTNSRGRAFSSTCTEGIFLACASERLVLSTFQELPIVKNPAVVFAAALLFGATAAAAQTPNDAQIASIVVTANQVDIDAGKLAQSKGSNAEVKAFGKQMVTDHTAVNKQASALAKKLKLKPEDNPTSQSLKSGGAENLKSLQKLKGAAFDKAYVEHEVAYHQQVIDAINKTLIPNAKNEELKQLLEKGLPLFEGHLEHAKQIQGALGK